MATIQEVKQQYPFLSDLDDNQVVDVMHQEYYSDLPRSDVANALGVKASERPAEQQKAPARSAFGLINDTVIDTANAAAGLVKAGSDLISPGNPVSNFIETNIIKDGQDKQSDRKKFYREQLASNLKKSSENDGTTSGQWAAEGRKAATQLNHAFTVDPMGTLGEIVGNIGPFAIIGKGLQALKFANWSKTAISSGLAGGLSMGEVRGNIWDKVSKMSDTELTEMSPAYAELRKGGMVEEEAKREVGANFMKNLPELAAVGAIGALSGKYGVEGMAAGVFPKMGRLAAGSVGALDEGLVQGGTEQVTSNYGVRRVNPKQSLIEDVGQNIVAEGLPGLAMGVASGGSSHPNTELEKVRESADKGGPLSKAALAVHTPPPDEISVAATAAEAQVRDAGMVQQLRDIAPQHVDAWLTAFAVARDTTKPTSTREEALRTIQDGLRWATTGTTDDVTPTGSPFSTELQTVANGPQPTPEVNPAPGAGLDFDNRTVDEIPPGQGQLENNPSPTLQGLFSDGDQNNGVFGNPGVPPGSSPGGATGQPLGGMAATPGSSTESESGTPRPTIDDVGQATGDRPTTDASPLTENLNEPTSPIPQQAAQKGPQAPAARKQVAAPRVKIAPEASLDKPVTAQARKRKAEIQALVNQGFTKLEQAGGKTALVNEATNEEHPLVGMVDTGLAKNALRDYATQQTTGNQNDTNRTSASGGGSIPASTGVGGRGLGEAPNTYAPTGDRRGVAPTGDPAGADQANAREQSDVEGERGSTKGTRTSTGLTRRSEDEVKAIIASIPRALDGKNNPKYVPPSDPRRIQIEKIFDVFERFTGHRPIAIDSPTDDGFSW